MSEDTSKLNPSKLGTKEYWDNFYKLEKSNFESNPEDTGENWFDDSDAENKMCQFLSDNIGELESIRSDSHIVDLGTGNGHLLYSLREEGFEGKLVGWDYSETSVAFAREIFSHNEMDATFARVDILADTDYLEGVEKFDIICDKGTLDAIALSDVRYGAKKETGVQLYSSNVRKIMKEGSVLLITSCNFTEEELSNIILSDDNVLKIWKKIKYPSFEFGGAKGSTICSIAFTKR